jgi:hypothetical protein
MLKELIHNKINEIFLEMQNKLGITDGGIDPFDALHLDELEEQLEKHIAKVLNYQQKEEPTMKEGQLIAVRGDIYEYGGIEIGDYTPSERLHKVYEIDIDDQGLLTNTHRTWYFSDEELKETKVNFTEDQWYGIVSHIIRQNHDVTEEEISEATEDIVGRCFAYGIPQFNELEEYIACYMNR